MQVPATMGQVHFGSFAVDLVSRELRKNGEKIGLQEKPFQLLAILLENQGQIVTREQFRQQLWPADTFVDFEHSVNTAVRKLREALGDDADKPVFIETLPRRGYRFLAPIEIEEDPAEGVSEFAGAVATKAARRSQRFWYVPATVLVSAAILVLAFNLGGIRNSLFHAKAKLPLRIESLAVLPLENLSQDPAQEYFADGLTDALITDLVIMV